jgi:hypothetical protein
MSLQKIAYLALAGVVLASTVQAQEIKIESTRNCTTSFLMPSRPRAR